MNSKEQKRHVKTKIKIMKNLSLKYQKIKGGVPKFKERVGYISAIYGNDAIIVDNYRGEGETYKQRKSPEVTIIKDGQHIFKANLDVFLDMVEKQDNTIFANYLQNKIVGNRFDTKTELSNRIGIDTGFSIFLDVRSVDMGYDSELYGEVTIEGNTFDLTFYYILDNQNKMYVTGFDMDLRKN